MFFELDDLTINNLKIVKGPGEMRDMKKTLLLHLEKPAKIIKYPQGMLLSVLHIDVFALETILNQE